MADLSIPAKTDQEMSIENTASTNADSYITTEESYSSSEEIDDELSMLANKEFSPIKSDMSPSPHASMYSTNNTDRLMQTAQDTIPGQNESSSFQERFNIDFSSISDTVPENDEELLDLNNLPETVTILKTKDNLRTIYLVGTSHFSKQSHRDVRRVIRTVQPSVVMLELCRSRMCFISMGEDEIMNETKSLDFSKIRDYMKRNGFVQGFIYTLLLTASAKVTKDLEMAPGGEFRNAFAEAIKIPGCHVMLGDRPVDITLRRAIATLSTWQKIKMTYNCLFSNEKLNEEELEKYKQKDVLEQLIGELSEEFPGLSEVMVRERDQYLAYSLWKLCQSTEPGANVVGVVGIGHSAGIKANWDTVENVNIDELLKIPAHKASKTMFVMKYSFYGLVGYGIYRYIVPNVVKTSISNVVSHASTKLLQLF